jgi:kinesin family protein C1
LFPLFYFSQQIYNETIRDLLVGPGTIDTKKHEVKHTDSQISITDLTIIPLEDEGHAFACLHRASTQRAIGETQMNGRSSRSHSVFQMMISGRCAQNGQSVHGKLNLIDLAGSERLSTVSTGAPNMQLQKETVHINKSLSGLADVIAALANGDKHVPYRNTKLTSVLQDSLGGNSKMLMFVNCSPALQDSSETLCSLRFASKVNSCHLGAVRKQSKIDLSSD